MSNLPFQTVWLTGASTGIGRALALELAGQGATVIASARSADKLDALAQEAEALPGAIIAWPLDVTDTAACTAAVEGIESQHGSIDVLIPNAGTFFQEPAGSWSVTAWQKTFDLNLMGVVNCVTPLLPKMLERGTGHIAITSSVAGYRGLPTSGSYGASKSALIHMAEVMHLDLKPQGIKVQVICPGFVKTPLTDKNEFPMPFLIDADDAARRIVKGLTSNRFEIAFPKRMVFLLKTLGALPRWLYFPLVSQGTQGRDD